MEKIANSVTELLSLNSSSEENSQGSIDQPIKMKQAESVLDDEMISSLKIENQDKIIDIDENMKQT